MDKARREVDTEEEGVCALEAALSELVCLCICVCCLCEVTTLILGREDLQHIAVIVAYGRVMCIIYMCLCVYVDAFACYL